uniref:Uncharacterized protein n=1 Tax=Anopheles coluzzii TaxID=1518534 RepID=A0A8W7PEQ3_ANOCL
MQPVHEFLVRSVICFKTLMLRLTGRGGPMKRDRFVRLTTVITVALWIVYNGKGYGFQVADHLMVLIGSDMVLVRLLLLLLLLGGLLCCRLQAVVVLLVLQHTTGAVKIRPLERIEQAALLLLALLLEEQPNVVDREDDALAGRFFRVDVNAPHQHRVGAVQQDQQQQGGTVRYPVAEERIVWRVG